jgi:hypothetical protein
MAHSKPRSIQRARSRRPCWPPARHGATSSTPQRDDAEFTLELPVTPETADDVELFHSALVGYATVLHDGVPPTPAPGVVQNGVGLVVGEAAPDDLRGRFVLVNEVNGEIVGALDRSVRCTRTRRSGS